MVGHQALGKSMLASRFKAALLPGLTQQEAS